MCHNIAICPGNPAPFPHNIIITEPILSHCSKEAFALLNDWLNECIEKHECCKRTFSQDQVDPCVEPELPTRVLEVSQPQKSDSLRLVETLGAHGHYTALSHCWGPLSKRPLTTTIDTLKWRLKNIPFESLTKTFQDAVTVTRAIGLRYLWIDSLCIIQDDNADWLNEASHMGSIYERSQLTIAAAGAADGSIGCFMERPPLPPAVELPNITEHGERAGSIFVALKAMKRDTHPDYSPLNERAWITQEWLLPLRTVYYTKGQMVWSCKKKSQGEDYEHLRLVARITADKLHWPDLVGNYCARKLTFNKDKLIALQGIASAWQKRTGDEWIYGVWTNALLRDIFWRAPEDSTFAQRLIRPGDLPIPSWSWASTQGQISFDNVDLTDQFCSKISIDHVSGRLSVCSRIKTLAAAGFDGPLDPEKPGTGYYVLDQDDNRVGKAYFDEAKVPDGMILCAPLVKIGHGSPPDPLNLGWFKVLLVQQSIGEPGLHVRVGIGEIDELSWFEGVPEVPISIH